MKLDMIVYGKRLIFIAVSIFLGLSSYAQTTGDTLLYKKSLAQFKQGKRDLQFLKILAIQAASAKDESNATIVANEYIKRLKSPLDSTDASLIATYTKKSSDPGFKYLLKEPALIDKKLGNDRSINTVIFIIYKEEIEKEVTGDNAHPDWKQIETRVVKKFGDPGQQIVWKAKAIHFLNHNDWNEFIPAYDQYLMKYGKREWSVDINNNAWEVFQHVSDTNLLSTAISWSKRVMAESDDPQYLDTYANLLYKMGETDKAIKTEEEVVEKIPANMKAEFEATLQKMRNGEKTWE